MDWSDEQWVKLYRRDTADWLLLSWRARGLFYSLLRIVTRAGVLDLGKTGKRAVAVLLGAGSDWKEIVDALDELVADGSVQINGATLVIPNFVEAQEAVKSDKARAKAARERRRDEAIAAGATAEPWDSVTKRDAAITDRDGAVTGNESPSRGVTERHAASRREEMETEMDGRGGAGETAAEEPPSAVAPKASPPGGSPSGASSSPSETPKATKATKAKRAKSAPEPDTIPLPGTLARRVYDAIVNDRALAPITANPGDAAMRWTDPGAFPGVDVLAVVLRGAEYVATVPGKYNDGRRFLRNQLQSKADEIARAPKPAGAYGGSAVAQPTASQPHAPRKTFLGDEFAAAAKAAREDAR